MSVIGTATTTNIHQSFDTINDGSPSPFVSKAKKLVPKKLHTKLAGRYSIVNVAIVFIAALSFRVSYAILVLSFAICRLVTLSRFAVRLYSYSVLAILFQAFQLI